MHGLYYCFIHRTQKNFKFLFNQKSLKTNCNNFLLDCVQAKNEDLWQEKNRTYMKGLYENYWKTLYVPGETKTTHPLWKDKFVSYF